jgi:CheY-like chemotaxis protein
VEHDKNANPYQLPAGRAIHPAEVCQEMKNVLIVDGDPFIRSLFSGLLKSQSGFFNVRSAENGKAACAITEKESIQVVITGPNLRELEVLELVMHLARHQPSIRVIVFTSRASGLLRSRIRKTTNAINFDGSQNIGQLARRLFTELPIDFGGQLKEIGLSAFLQMMELEGRSATLQISAKGKTGFLYLSEGAPIAAALGPISGKKAALAILGWKQVAIDIDFSPPEREQEFSESLMNLLLEAGRLDDEQNSQLPEKRRHERFNCLVAVDYDISNWNYQSFLRDISLGGAYLESEQPAFLGSRMTLSLAAPGAMRCCKVQGKVIRCDPRGIGVSFANLSLKQKEVIQALAALRPQPAAGDEPEVAAEPGLELFG